jgi:hypothetical protein
MKLKFAILAMTVLAGASLSVGSASAMPLAPLQSHATPKVETVALVCGQRGCVRTYPTYRRGYVVARPYVRRGYGYGGYRRY